MTADLKPQIIAALRHRMVAGRHLHHRNCIHNLPPVEQIEVRGKTVEWWTQMVGSMPVQITPDDWEIEPPYLRADGGTPQ